jgi:hypothetical protein
MRRVVLLFCLAVPLLAQHGPVNLSFKEMRLEGTPTGWVWNGNPSYSVTSMDECRGPDSHCAMFRSPTENVPHGGGYFMQTFNATEFRGKQVRYRAWLRLEAPALSRT